MFGKFNAANRRLNKFNRTRGGLSKIIKIMGVTAVFIFGVGLAIALGEDDQVGGSDAKGTQFIKRVDVDDPLPETNPDGTINGLNWLLVGKMNEGYLKELLTILDRSQKGELCASKYHVDGASVLGISANESGTYPNGMPKSYLPYANNKVVWKESYGGVSAENMTIENLDPSSISWKHWSETNYKGIFQMSASMATGVKSSLNPKGYVGTRGHVYYYPDNLAYLDTRLSNAIQTFYSTMTEADMVDGMAGAITAGTHNAGEAGFILPLTTGMSWRKYSGLTAKIDELNVKAIKEYVTDLTKDMTSISKYRLDSNNSRAVATYLLTENGWFIDDIGWSYLNSARGGVTDRAAEICLGEGKTREDLMNYFATKHKALPISDSEAQSVYGMISSSSTHNFWANTPKGAIYKMDGSEQVLPDGRSIKTIRWINMETNGQVLMSLSTGNFLFASSLKMGGLEDVDPTNPDTYMNKFENEWVPDGTTDWLREYGVDPSKVNPKRIAILNEGYKLRGTPYLYGGYKVPIKNPDGSYQVETGLFDCSAFVHYIIKETTGVDVGRGTSIQINDSDLQTITPQELLPGDLIILGNNGGTEHVIMYISGDATTNNFVYMDTASPETGGVKIATDATWQRNKRKQWTCKRIKGID